LATRSSADQRPKAAAVRETTDDAFLDGRVRVLQPKRGFRAGLDSVMLAAAVPAHAGDRVCDLGAGVATAVLCLAARVGGLHVTAVEIDEVLAALARQNGARNGGAAAFAVVVADVLKRPRSLPRQGFDHVLTNPPYHDIGRGTRAPERDKAKATSANARDLVEWLRFARALARPKGTVSAILPPDQLAHALSALSPAGAGVDIVPLWPMTGAPAKRVIVRVRMNSLAPMRLHAGLVLHEVGGAPTPAAEAVLRHAEALIT
jgi:tRNA1(Val) A37 N6-methylase TrmN6